VAFIISSSVAPRVRVSSATTASDLVFLFGLRALRAAAVRAPFAGASASGVVGTAGSPYQPKPRRSHGSPGMRVLEPSRPSFCAAACASRCCADFDLDCYDPASAHACDNARG
jgi:hypothetical protein